MKIVAVADLHGHLPSIPACSLLIIGGDICPIHNHNPIFQAHWLDTVYRQWLNDQPATHKIGIAGNHDWAIEQRKISPYSLPWNYLETESVTIEGLKIWGSPWTPRFCDWAYNADPEQLEYIWSRIPDDTNILVTHGPPRGYGDRVPRYASPGYEECGCPHLLNRIQQLHKLRLHVYGHIHDDSQHKNHGVRHLLNAGWDGDNILRIMPGAKLVNASIATDHAGFANQPIEINI